MLVARTWLWILAFAACREPAAPAPAPPIGSAELPGWFGLPDRPARRIAGRVLADGDVPFAATVSLRIDVPDARVWTGLEVTTGPDGRFDFGALRAGRYQVVATGPRLTSRVVEIDTRAKSAEAVPIYAYPCRTRTVKVMTFEKAVVRGTELDLHGRVLGKTGNDGTLQLCRSSETIAITIRGHGVATETHWLYAGDRELMVGPAMDLVGRLTRKDGRPVAGAAIQPVLHNRGISHSSPDPLPLQATTDEDGRFVIRDAIEIRVKDENGRDLEDYFTNRYDFRVLDRDVDIERLVPVITKSPRAYDVNLSRTFEHPPEHNALVKVTGCVRHDGKPLPDASVSISYPYEPSVHTRTRADGTFELEAPSKREPELGISHPRGLHTRRHIQLVPGKPSTDLVIDVGGRAQISGFLVDPEGNPLAGLPVAATARDTAHWTWDRTDPSGAFTTTVEAGHTYDLEVHRHIMGGRLMLGELAVMVDSSKSGLRLVVREPELVGQVVGVNGEGVAATLETDDGGPITTDASGHFKWALEYYGPHSIVARANDGRVGALDDVVATTGPLRISLQQPGGIQIVCKPGFTPERDPVIVHEERRISARCGSTVASLPPGRHLVVAVDRNDCSRIANLEVEVSAGSISNAVLEVKPHVKIRGRLVRYPDRTPLAGYKCEAGADDGDDGHGGFGGPTTTSAKDGRFELAMSPGLVHVMCTSDRGRFSGGPTRVDLRGDTTVEIRVIWTQANAVDTGATIRAEARGARLVGVRRLAAASGLRAGDVVQAVDGVSLAGLTRQAMLALAFTIPANKPTTWRVIRDGVPRDIQLVW